jgi:hypothetical protein
MQWSSYTEKEKKLLTIFTKKVDFDPNVKQISSIDIFTDSFYLHMESRCRKRKKVYEIHLLANSIPAQHTTFCQIKKNPELFLINCCPQWTVRTS